MTNSGPTPQREVARFDEARSRDAALTYEPFYRLAQKPFSLAADPQFLFRSETRGPVFDDLLTAIRRREGLIVLTSDIGMGKTTLCRSAIQQLDRKTFSAFVPDPFMSREDLLKTLLMDFGVVSIDELRGGHLRAASRLELSYVLYEFLDSLVPLQAFAVVFIDEAQNLSIPLLEEVRILSDLVGREKLLQVVLVGQLELEAKLKLPEMRQVDHRVAMRCSLAPFSDDEARRYVKHRLGVASTPAATATFSADALEVVCQVSRGVPRVINMLCDRALYESFRVRANEVDAASVWKAADRLALTRTEPLQHQRAAQPSHEPAGTPPPTAPAAAEPSPAMADFAETLPEFLSEEEMFGDQRKLQADPNQGEESRTRWLRAGSAVAFLTAVAMISGVLSWHFFNQLWGSAAIQAPVAPPAPYVRLVRLPAPVQPPSDLAFDAGATYAIQIASFESEDRAVGLTRLLAEAGIPARTVERDLGAAGRWHQVLADGYLSLEAAKADLARIHDMGGYADARLVSVSSGMR